MATHHVTPKEAREDVKRDAPRVGVSAKDIAKAPLMPASGGSYRRTADGELRRVEAPTEPNDRPTVEPILTDEEIEANRKEAERIKAAKE